MQAGMLDTILTYLAKTPGECRGSTQIARDTAYRVDDVIAALRGLKKDGFVDFRDEGVEFLHCYRITQDGFVLVRRGGYNGIEMQHRRSALYEDELEGPVWSYKPPLFRPRLWMRKAAWIIMLITKAITKVLIHPLWSSVIAGVIVTYIAYRMGWI